MREVIKRDGSHVAFDESKIYQAILKAMKYGSGILDEGVAKKSLMKLMRHLRINTKHLLFFKLRQPFI